MNPTKTPRTNLLPLTLGNPTFRRRFVAATLLGALVCILPTASAVAKSPKGKAAQTPAGASAIEPDAMDALNKMGAYLRTLKAFQVLSDSTTDEVLEDGQAIQYSTKVNMLAEKPNGLRVEITADDEHRFYLFDGKNFTIYGAMAGFYATVPAPPTIKEMIDKISDKYDIEFPLTDLFLWGTDDAAAKKITSAIDVGPTSVNGITCEQYAFRQEGVDWQIWIQLGDFPLPLKYVIRTLTDDAKPQHSAELTWNLAPSFNREAFTFDPPADAHRILLKDMTAPEKK